MSQTVKSITSAFLLGTVLTTATFAQEMDEDFFSGLTAGAPVTNADSSGLIEKIDEMIGNVSSMKIEPAQSENITIDEIDRSNRESQRLKNDITLREMKYKEMTSQLEMLITLEDAKQALIKRAQEQAQADAELNGSTTDQSGNEARAAIEAEQKAALEALATREQQTIPRVSEIHGTADRRFAQIESPTGVIQEVGVGDIVVNGFKVSEISLQGVTLTGTATGKQYFVAPSQKIEAAPAANLPTPALNMQSNSFPGMF